jgi:sortase A
VEADAESTSQPRRPPARLSRALLFIEVAAVVGLLWVLFSGVGVLRLLNQEVAEALDGGQAAATPRITAVVLPSGHTPPTSPGGAQPNEAEIPQHLRPLVQNLPAVVIPTPGPEQASTIFIPALWEFPAPVVQGDGWEQLKKGVGQHIGSTDPGRPGNLVLSAHNDIFGELFRHLDRLQPGDEIVLTTATREFVYRVTGTEIVEPTDVRVMDPTNRPTVTLVSCYPYLVDTERIVVFAELVDG